jgi:hypothetical protein
VGEQGDNLGRARAAGSGMASSMVGRAAAGEAVPGRPDAGPRRVGVGAAGASSCSDAGAAEAWGSTDSCYQTFFFRSGGPLGSPPDENDCPPFSCLRADPNRSNQTDLNTKMGWPVGDALRHPP